MENRQTAETILEWDGDQEDGEGISEKWAGLWWGQSHQCGSIWHLVSLPRSLGQPGSLLWDGLNKTFKVLMPSTSTWKKAEQITAGETQAAQHCSLWRNSTLDFTVIPMETIPQFLVTESLHFEFVEALRLLKQEKDG